MFRKNTKIEILCIGSTSVDLFFPTDEGVIIDTPEDITSQKKYAFELGGKILVPELYTAIGGVAANVARGLARLGVSSGLYSCLGQDNNGEFCLKALRKSGVITEKVQVLSDADTDLSAILVHTPTGDRTIIHNRDANKRLIIDTRALRTPWVFISSLNGEWQKNIQSLLQAKQAPSGFRIALNPGQHNIKEDSALIHQVIRHTEVLILNKDEAIELVLYKNAHTSEQELNDEFFLVKNLLQGEVKVVALTDGLRGAWAYSGQEFWHLTVPKNREVLDTTGAGDAFTSGFLAAYLQNCRVDECLRVGMANSQQVIQKYGASEHLLSSEEMEKAILHLIPQKVL